MWAGWTGSDCPSGMSVVGVVCVCAEGGGVQLLLASAVNGFHQSAGRLKKGNGVIHLLQLPLPAEQSKHTEKS